MAPRVGNVGFRQAFRAVPPSAFAEERFKTNKCLITKRKARDGVIGPYLSDDHILRCSRSQGLLLQFGLALGAHLLENRLSPGERSRGGLIGPTVGDLTTKLLGVLTGQLGNAEERGLHAHFQFPLTEHSSNLLATHIGPVGDPDIAYAIKNLFAFPRQFGKTTVCEYTLTHTQTYGT